MAKYTEAQHQTFVMKWSRQPSVRGEWPELELLYHVKNETKEGVKQVAIDRSSGVKKGVPDLCLPVARGQYHGLYIELKAPSGKVTDEQAWWVEALNKQGYFAEVCHGWESAVRVLSWYMTLPTAMEATS